MLSRTDTRFAGSITAETGLLEETTPVVIVNLLGVQADLVPEEAVRLAVRLIEAAARSEREGESEWP